jgi:hypothetical protein
MIPSTRLEAVIVAASRMIIDGMLPNATGPRAR